MKKLRNYFIVIARELFDSSLRLLVIEFKDQELKLTDQLHETFYCTIENDISVTFLCNCIKYSMLTCSLENVIKSRSLQFLSLCSQLQSLNMKSDSAGELHVKRCTIVVSKME